MENNIFQGVNMQESLQTARELGTQQSQAPVQQLTAAELEQLKQLQERAAQANNIPRQEVSETPSLPEGHISGIVVNTQEVLADAQPTPVQSPSALNDETLANINSYLEEYDERVEEAKEKFDTKQPQLATPQESENTEETDDDESDEEDNTQEEFLKEYNEAIVILDKTGMGTVNFTPEERQKLEKVKKIKVTEIETLDLATITTKKPKKKELTKIIQKAKNTIKTTSIVLPASGYTAVIRGCSAYELLELVRDGKNPLQDNEAKWNLIYSKLESTSIGMFKDFDDFLRHTSTLDYSTFIYGILCATYPDESNDDVIPLTCQNCKQEFDHKYTIKSLIRAELMDDELREQVANVIDSSYTLTTAVECHENSPVNQVKRYKLPQSEIIVDLAVQSVHDFIYQSVKKLSNKKDSKYSQASILSTAVQTFYIPDADGSYFEIDDPEEVTEVIYNLNDTDIKVLNVKMQDLLTNKQLEFGLMDMTCPHCQSYIESLPMNLEQILFYKYQKALNTEVE